MSANFNPQSEMAQLILSKDWSATAMGPIETWPETLLNALRLCLDSAFPIAIYWGDDLTLLYNDAWRPLAGNKHPECLGQSAPVVWKEVWQDLKPQFEIVRSTQRAVFYTDQLLRIIRDQDPEEAYFDYSFSPIRSASAHGLAGIYNVGIEVTARVLGDRANRRLIHELADERQKLTDTSSLLNLALAAAQIGTWDLDLKTGLVRNSARTTEIFGLPRPGELHVSESLNRIHAEDRARVEAVIQAATDASSDGHYDLDYRIVRDDGTIRWVQVSGQAIFEPGTGGSVSTRFSGTIFDITAAVHAKQELLKAKEIAENANLAKSAFLANMSHEIRTPLAAILGFSELLKEKNLSLPERDKYIETIVRAGKALTSIIDDILDLAKVESGRYEIEKLTFSTFDLLSEAVDLFKDQARQKGIFLLLNIEDHFPVKLVSDPARIRQILVNLIGNAVKFTEKGSVRISAKSIPNKNGFFQIEVKDTGIGLSIEQQDKLFSPFVQADNSTSRKFGGTGLGLALSQRLAKALGGVITIADCFEGIGSTFRFEFPATPDAVLNETRKSAPEDQRPTPLQNIRALVIDDSAENLFLVQRLLMKNGAVVETVSDGREGINLATSKTFDVILCDIQMPNLDGYQTLQILKSREVKIPVIALTAHAMADERARTRAAGFVAHLTKPLNSSELISTIVKFAGSQ